MKQIVILGTALLLGTYIFSKKKFADSVRFSFDKIKIQGKKIFVTLGVSNPTNQSLTINSIVGDLILNGSTIAAVESFVTTTIKPNAKTFLQVQLIPSGLGILQQAKMFLLAALQKKNDKKKEKQKIASSFKGSANVQGNNFPINASLMN